MVLITALNFYCERTTGVGREFVLFLLVFVTYMFQTIKQMLIGQKIYE